MAGQWMVGEGGIKRRGDVLSFWIVKTIHRVRRKLLIEKWKMMGRSAEHDEVWIVKEILCRQGDRPVGRLGNVIPPPLSCTSSQRKCLYYKLER